MTEPKTQPEAGPLVLSVEERLSLQLQVLAVERDEARLATSVAHRDAMVREAFLRHGVDPETHEISISTGTFNPKRRLAAVEP